METNKQVKQPTKIDLEALKKAKKAKDKAKSDNQIVTKQGDETKN